MLVPDMTSSFSIVHVLFGAIDVGNVTGLANMRSLPTSFPMQSLLRSGLGFE